MTKKLFTIGALAVLLICLKIYLYSEMHFLFYPYIDTKFSKGFLWENFNKIAPGAEKEKVLSLLNEPLEKFKANEFECWFYSTDGKLWPYADFSYYRVEVCFRGDKVEFTQINEFNN